MVRVMLSTGKAVEVGIARKPLVVIGDRPGDPLFVPDVEAFADDEDEAFGEQRRLRAAYPDVAWFVMRLW